MKTYLFVVDEEAYVLCLVTLWLRVETVVLHNLIVDGRVLQN